ncbi:hypothetical protein [Pseudoalteromonas piscicida]|uniref:hypothetical protein n=1 Tax=Pseudoalteromonas piscicida TaxID=43662 RepID=UPI001C96B47D|nr:hypothetical protein [Pseudoalteromonas piscicida]QZO12612.1 hypothetical protein K5642_16245 [Pseudoalteromonas piscicida]
MGLFSSKSRSTSNQTTNNTSTNFGIQGDNNGFITNGDGNTYNIQQTDYGLVGALESIGGNMADSQIAGFDFARDAVTGAQGMALDMTEGAFDFASNVNRDSLDNMYGLATDSLGFGRGAMDSMAGLATDSLEFGRGAMDSMAGLATDSIDAQSSLARDAIAENGELANSLMGYTSEANARLSDLAMYSVDAADNSNARMSDVAAYSMDNASNLARDLGAQFMDSTSAAQETFNDQTLLAHKQALQFANDASRSDGQQLAINTNKTMMVIVSVIGSVAVLGALAAMFKDGG